MRNRVYATVGRPFVCPVRLSHAAAAGLLRWARRPEDIDRSIAARPAVSSSRATAQHAAADAGSTTLSADVGS